MRGGSTGGREGHEASRDRLQITPESGACDRHDGGCSGQPARRGWSCGCGNHVAADVGFSTVDIDVSCAYVRSCVTAVQSRLFRPKRQPVLAGNGRISWKRGVSSTGRTKCSLKRAAGGRPHNTASHNIERMRRWRCLCQCRWNGLLTWRHGLTRLAQRD